MLEYKFDTQLLIEGTGLDEDRSTTTSPTTSRATVCWPWATTS